MNRAMRVPRQGLVTRVVAMGAWVIACLAGAVTRAAMLPRSVGRCIDRCTGSRACRRTFAGAMPSSFLRRRKWSLAPAHSS